MRTNGGIKAIDRKSARRKAKPARSSIFTAVLQAAVRKEDEKIWTGEQSLALLATPHDICRCWRSANNAFDLDFAYRAHRKGKSGGLACIEIEKHPNKRLNEPASTTETFSEENNTLFVTIL
ncbi:hypothetical protein [Halochromatium glycolicum]|uniref:hypothetical protein n=1 Tax=Halochromatium glycolicum TaxID=85075 RepID=UPI00190DE46B|nr:hypothetical protein [Halochromatium glycolicum]